MSGIAVFALPPACSGTQGVTGSAISESKVPSAQPTIACRRTQIREIDAEWFSLKRSRSISAFTKPRSKALIIRRLDPLQVKDGD